MAERVVISRTRKADQPAVQEAVDQIAAVRKQLLDVMFSPKRKK